MIRTTRMALPLYPLRSTCEPYRRGSVIANVIPLFKRNRSMELNLKLEQVHDRDSFFEFVRQLVSDRRMEIEREAMDTSSPSPHDAAEWENSTIDSYLDAALSLSLIHI